VIWRVSGLAAVVLILAPIVVLALLSWVSRRPDTLGLHAGRLRACPAKPNCVCSQDADSNHAIAPLTFAGDRTAAWERLKNLLVNQPRAQVITATADYLHVEFSTRLFRFVDDVEFFLPPDGSQIHCRSASRAGHSDLGVNRQRIEQLRAEFDKAAL